MTNAHVGKDVDVSEIRAQNDAVVICTGATWPRDLKIPNREEIVVDNPTKVPDLTEEILEPYVK